MLKSKGQMNAETLKGASNNSKVVIDAEAKELSRYEIRQKLDELGIEYSNKANTKTLKKLLGE